MKGSLVGESEQMIRNALKSMRGMGGERVLIVATCNKLAVLPPELRRRFRLGLWFFDLPDASEKASIWSVQRAAFSLDDSTLPEDTGWSGANIRDCCELAYSLDCSLSEAAVYVVPAAVQDAEGLERLRSLASGRFLSASKPGTYHYQLPKAIAGSGSRRNLQLTGDN